MQSRPLLVAGAAIAIGFACGTATRPAPERPAATGPDTADGILARGSRDPTVVLGYGAVAYGAAGYGQPPSPDPTEELLNELDADFGVTSSYGGSVAGTMYGNYKIDTRAIERNRWQPRPPVYQGYQPAELTSKGAITGTVSWRRPPGIAERLPAPARAGCGATIANRSLARDRRGRIAGAVVYLEQIRQGRALLRGMTGGFEESQRLQIGGTVIARGCELWPRVQLVAPIGATLRAARLDDSIPGLELASGTIRMAARGRAYLRSMEAVGFWRLQPTNGVPAAAWAVVPPHPYYAVTAADGSFRLGEVPPGRYRLVVWHPPLIEKIASDGSPVTTGPVTRSRAVTVRAGRAAAVSLSLD